MTSLTSSTKQDISNPVQKLPKLSKYAIPGRKNQDVPFSEIFDGFVVAGVADGNGPEGGVIAPELVRGLLKEVGAMVRGTGKVDKNSIKECLVRLNDNILEMKESEVSGSTLSGSIFNIKDNKVWIFNVGDSKTLIMRGRDILFQTKDHLPTEEDYKKVSRKRNNKKIFNFVFKDNKMNISTNIQHSGILYHKYTDNAMLVIGSLTPTSIFGHRALKSQMKFTVDITKIRCYPGIKIISYSDGVSDVFTNDELIGCSHVSGVRAMDVHASDVRAMDAHTSDAHTSDVPIVFPLDADAKIIAELARQRWQGLYKVTDVVSGTIYDGLHSVPESQIDDISVAVIEM